MARKCGKCGQPMHEGPVDVEVASDEGHYFMLRGIQGFTCRCGQVAADEFAVKFALGRAAKTMAEA